MAKTNITQYSSTPSSNTDINNINIDENCPASGLNNAIRELMAHLKNVDTGSQALTALSVTGDTTISSGDLLVSATTITGFQSSNTESGTIAYNAGGIASNSPTNDVAGVFNRLGNDGIILQLKKSGATVGSIGSIGGQPYFINSSNKGIRPYTNGVAAAGSAGAFDDDAQDLGASSVRWRNLYLSGGVYLGGTGSANYLDDYEEGTWTPTVANGTVSSLSANYIKIGKRVTLHAKIESFSDRSTAGSITITNLPFAQDTSKDEVAVGTAMWRYVNKVHNTVFLATSGLQFYTSESADFVVLKHNDLNNSSSNVYLFATYITT